MRMRVVVRVVVSTFRCGRFAVHWLSHVSSPLLTSVFMNWPGQTKRVRMADTIGAAVEDAKETAGAFGTIIASLAVIAVAVAVIALVIALRSGHDRSD